MQQKILIVEDEFIIANQLKELLEMEGYVVIGPTDDYAHSISLITEEMPDLVIADIRLHDDNEAGIKVSEFVSKHYHIPVIFLSGYSDEETITKAKKTNPNTFLIKPKPLNKEQLLTTIKMALPNSNIGCKLKSVLIKGKEIKISESYSQFKDQEKIDYVSKLINFDDVAYVETYNHFFKNTLLIRFSSNEKGFLVREEIESFNLKCPSHFLRVHKSFLVNMNKIDGHRLSNYLIIKDTSIPIGQKYSQALEIFLNRTNT